MDEKGQWDLMGETDTKLDIQAMAAFEAFWTSRSADIQFVRTTMPEDDFAELLRFIYMNAYADGSLATLERFGQRLDVLGDAIAELDRRIA